MVGVAGNPHLRPKVFLSGQQLSFQMDEGKSTWAFGWLAQKFEPRRDVDKEKNPQIVKGPVWHGQAFTIRYCVMPEDVRMMTAYWHKFFQFEQHERDRFPQLDYFQNALRGYADVHPYSDLALCRTYSHIEARPDPFRGDVEDGVPYTINAICLPRAPVSFQKKISIKFRGKQELKAPVFSKKNFENFRKFFFEFFRKLLG